MNLLTGLFHRNKDGVETPIEIEGMADDTLPPPPVTKVVEASAGTLAPQKPDPELAALREELKAEREARAEEKRLAAKAEADRRTAEIRSASKAFAAKAVGDRKLLTDKARDGLADLHAYHALASAGLPTEGIDGAKALDAFVSGLPAHNLTGEKVPASYARLDPDADGAPTDQAARERLLSRYEHGAAAIAASRANGNGSR